MLERVVVCHESVTPQGECAELLGCEQCPMGYMNDECEVSEKFVMRSWRQRRLSRRA